MPNLAVRGLKAALRPARRRLWGPATRAEKDYATHIPILLALARAVKVENVLELGCGDYSTLTFLDSSAFPSLVSLESLETDKAWLEKVALTVGDDSRFSARLVNSVMRSGIKQVDIDSYELVLVDDSSTSDERAGTIRAIADYHPKRAIVVIHDFEIQAYREAASGFLHQFIFKAFTPQTGVVWNGNKDLMKTLRQASSAIKRNAKKVAPDDVGEWKKVLS